ncbi:DNA polymerase lambda [Brachionus plicatilis]|uniref:DNA polymerase lambda n=1 Tax=Brachionus plicatilis TaxID=10195 RepID=A0A3M7QF57_BRAPC|nr:DNA polymerase lambda [Brachionus plicatilis]
MFEFLKIKKKSKSGKKQPNKENLEKKDIAFDTPIKNELSAQGTELISSVELPKKNITSPEKLVETSFSLIRTSVNSVSSSNAVTPRISRRDLMKFEMSKLKLGQFVSEYPNETRKPPHNARHSALKNIVVPRLELEAKVMRASSTPANRSTSSNRTKDDPVYLSKFAGGYEPDPNLPKRIESLEWLFYDRISNYGTENYGKKLDSSSPKIKPRSRSIDLSYFPKYNNYIFDSDCYDYVSKFKRSTAKDSFYSDAKYDDDLCNQKIEHVKKFTSIRGKPRDQEMLILNHVLEPDTTPSRVCRQNCASSSSSSPYLKRLFGVSSYATGINNGRNRLVNSRSSLTECGSENVFHDEFDLETKKKIDQKNHSNSSVAGSYQANFKLPKEHNYTCKEINSDLKPGYGLRKRCKLSEPKMTPCHIPLDHSKFRPKNLMKSIEKKSTPSLSRRISDSVANVRAWVTSCPENNQIYAYEDLKVYPKKRYSQGIDRKNLEKYLSAQEINIFNPKYFLIMFKITKKIVPNDLNKPIEVPQFFQGINAFILPNGMGKIRLDLFQNAIVKHGGILLDETSPIDQNLTSLLFIIFDESTIQNWRTIDITLSKRKFYHSLKALYNQELGNKVSFVRSSWLSECLKQKKIISTSCFEIIPEKEDKIQDSEHNKECLKRKNSDDNVKNEKKSKISVTEAVTECKIILKDHNKYENRNDSSYSEDESYLSGLSNQEFLELQLKSRSNILNNNKSWTCAHSSKEQSENMNKHITDKLEQMLIIYENKNEKYRALGYQKAILILKRHPKEIQSREEALALPGIGKRIADKIWEILQTGDFRKLDEMSSREETNSLKLFTDIHGVGPTTARLFLSQGFKTLEDLKTNANLTRQQKIGLKYYDEFNQRIPRDEVAKIENQVINAALSLNNGLIVQVCGSYRRGKATCGDVDILITHPDRKSHKGIYSKLLKLLHEQNFLTDDLVVQEENADIQCKYLGVCRLNEANSLHRRIDLIVVPFDEYACALLYFTGSAHFNRSMRHLARKLGLSLCEKSLNKNVIRNGTEKINTGERLVVHSEQDIFRVLNIPYREPEERDF